MGGETTYRVWLEVSKRHDEGLALAQPEGSLERAQAQRDVNEERVFAVVDHDDGRRGVVVQQPRKVSSCQRAQVWHLLGPYHPATLSFLLTRAGDTLDSRVGIAGSTCWGMML